MSAITSDNVNIRTREMHTGGEPLRVIESGFPSPQGRTLLEKIRYIRQNLDPYRKLLMYEPRGHTDMYGALLVPPDNTAADIAAIFMHNEGYSTMCGHAVIALGRYVVDVGLVRNPSSPETRVAIQCPCGLVEAFVEYNDGKTGNVRFNSVPAFVFASDVSVDVPGYGHATVDIVYGGAFYAFITDSQYNLKLGEASIHQVRDAAGATTDALKKQLKLRHPDSDDLAFLYGTIVTDCIDSGDGLSSNICVFAERQIDRSPCGSGVTARLALQYHKGYTKVGQTKQFLGPTNSKFLGTVVQEVTYGGYKAVVVEVSGKGHYTGSANFTLENDDVIGRGFLLE